MIKTLAELKLFLKPGVIFKVTHAPSMLPTDQPYLREVTSIDAEGIHYRKPDPDLKDAEWNKYTLAWRPDANYHFDAAAFYFTTETWTGGIKRELGAYRCEYVTPIPA